MAASNQHEQALARVQFWGTRGSLPKPGKDTVRYGGNTSCVQVTSPGGEFLILDCGTGLHDLGQEMMAKGKGRAMRGSILISHTHWDHIQGFPFFVPLFIPGGEWDVFGPGGLKRSLREVLAGQMRPTYFPVTLEAMGAGPRFHDLAEGTFSIGDVQITTRYLNHPALTLGFRLEMAGVTVVYSCDHEPYVRSAGGGPNDELHALDKAHIDFLKGADLLIHDAQFTDVEYAKRRGWGHSPVEYVCEMARLAGVQKLALTHHDPTRKDDDLDRLVEYAKSLLKSAGSCMEVFAAADSQVLELAAAAECDPQPLAAPKPSALFEPGIPDAVAWIAVSDDSAQQTLMQAAAAAQIEVTSASDGETILALAASSVPSLVVLQGVLADMDGVELCHRLRQLDDPRWKTLPIVVVGDDERPAEGAAAGVTQWLLNPFSPQYAEAHLQSWILRSMSR